MTGNIKNDEFDWKNMGKSASWHKLKDFLTIPI